jgi:hypothetical protein
VAYLQAKAHEAVLMEAETTEGGVNEHDSGGPGG